MTLFANYDDWMDGIRDLLDVDESEYSDTRIGRFLYQGELTLDRRIRTRRTEEFVGTTIQEDVGGRISLPSDWNAPLFNYDDASGDDIEIVTRDEFFKQRARGGISVDGQPEIWTIIGSMGHFYPMGSGRDISLGYYKQVTHLEDGVTETNEFTVNYPDALLYAAALASAPFMIDDARLGTWKSELDRIIGEINATKQDEIFGSQPIRRRISNMSA